jgi:hypothetical protein
MTAARRLTSAQYLQLVGLMIGCVLGLGQMSFTGGGSQRVGQDQTTRLTRGLWFSPWYEEVERRTAGGVESRWEVRAISLSWPMLFGGIVCLVALFRRLEWPGDWLREVKGDPNPP